MTREYAKEILALYRPNGVDAQDPFFAEALELAAVDPVLADWLSEQQSFDRAVSDALARVPAPVESPRHGIRNRSPVRTGKRWMRPIEFALAASIALTASVGVLWGRARQPDFFRMRDRALQQTWAGERHVDLETTNLPEIRRFIAAHDLRGDFKLPPELAAMHPHGCKLLTVRGQSVPYICFVEGAKHLHLLVMDQRICPETPVVAAPDFEPWQNFTTATWTQGETTFVLVGMRPTEFVKKFRRDGQWTWGG